MSAHSKGSMDPQQRDQVLERLLDASLTDELAGQPVQLDGMAERVASMAVGEAPVRRGNRVLTAVMVAAGITVVAAVGWAVASGGQGVPVEPGLDEAGPQAPEANDPDQNRPDRPDPSVDDGTSQKRNRQQPQDPQPDTPAPQDLQTDASGKAIQLKTIEELRQLLPQFVRVECQALRFGGMAPPRPGSNVPPPPFVVADSWVLREVKETFGSLQKSDVAALHAWPNEIRLYLEDGRYVAFTFGADIRHMSFKGLGDVKYHPGFIKAFSGLVKKANWAAQRLYGVVMRPGDLKKRGEDDFPAGIRTMSLVGGHAFDLSQVARFQELRTLQITGEAARYAARMDFAAISGMPWLEEVSIRHGRVYRDQLSELAKLPNLKVLNLEYAELPERDLDENSSIMPPSPWGELAACKTLTTLRCGYAKPMDNRAMDAIQTIQTLEHLDLSSRKLGFVNAQDLSGLDALKNLKVLKLSMVPLDLTPLMSALQDAGTQLEVLDLSDTKLDDRAAGRIGMFERLREIDLSRCTELSADGLRTICAGCPLEALVLSGNRLLSGGDLGEALQGAKGALRRLNLEQTGYTDEVVGALRGMRELRELDLSFTGAGDKSLTWLMHLGSLERIELTGVKGLTDEALRAIAPKSVTTGGQNGIGLGTSQFKGLRYLDVSLCDGLTEEAVQAFAAARPECTVRATQFDMR